MVKKTKMYATVAVAGLIMLGLSMEAQATLIEISGADTISEDSTDFVFTETGLGDYQIADGELGTFAIDLSNNFQWGSADDHLSWNIDGIVQGQLHATDNSSQWGISNSDMNNILSNGGFGLSIHYCASSTGSNKHNWHGNSAPDTDWGPGAGGFTWELSYESGSAAPVPEPATMLLMATGLIGMGAFNRKKKG